MLAQHERAHEGAQMPKVARAGGGTARMARPSARCADAPFTLSPGADRPAGWKFWAVISIAYLNLDKVIKHHPRPRTSRRRSLIKPPSSSPRFRRKPSSTCACSSLRQAWRKWRSVRRTRTLQRRAGQAHQGWCWPRKSEQWKRHRQGNPRKCARRSAPKTAARQASDDVRRCPHCARPGLRSRKRWSSASR
jgi:hypothetical protein